MSVVLESSVCFVFLHHQTYGKTKTWRKKTEMHRGDVNVIV